MDDEASSHTKTGPGGEGLQSIPDESPFDDSMSSHS